MRLARTVIVAALLLVTAAPVAFAQDANKLVEVLRHAPDYRVRLRAAMALGRVGERDVVLALEAALSDPNASVRSAAATALGRRGETRSLRALAALENDRKPMVKAAAKRAVAAIEKAARKHATATTDLAFDPRPGAGMAPDKNSWSYVERVIVLGDIRSSADYQDARMVALLRERAVDRLREMPRTAVLVSESAMTDDAKKAIAERALPIVRLDGNLRGFMRKSDDGMVSVRCEVSFFLLDAKQQSLKAEIRGAATSSEPRRGLAHHQNLSLAGRAVAGAVESALANAERAFVAVAKN